jgi:L-fuconolactonase
MITIDAHQHFWKYNPLSHSWIDDAMAVIRKDFLPEDLAPVLKANGVAGCIAVQADQSEAETVFLIALAAQNDMIKGVVGWVDLCAANIDERLDYFQQFPIVKGFRHILQAEDPSFIIQPVFLRGISSLKKNNFTYDLLIYPKHLPAAIQLVKQNPDQYFVVDHIAKPFIKNGLMEGWKEEIKELATFKNVYCKLSGLVTEADNHKWKQQDFIPYLDTVTECFGIDRMMFGSDWPVSLVAASYDSVLAIIKTYFESFSADEKAKIMGLNAFNFYHLK